MSTSQQNTSRPGWALAGPGHSGRVTHEPAGREVAASATGLAILYTLALAAAAVCVFYASVHPVTIAAGFLAYFDNLPWRLALLLLTATWALCPLPLLALGLVHLHLRARLGWWPAAAWLGLLAAATGTGYLILGYFGLLFTSYPMDGGEPSGPSQFDPGGPFWPALLAAAGELAVCALMIALLAAWPRAVPASAS
jgi:hypothetical protein